MSRSYFKFSFSLFILIGIIIFNTNLALAAFTDFTVSQIVGTTSTSSTSTPPTTSTTSTTTIPSGGGGNLFGWYDDASLMLKSLNILPRKNSSIFTWQTNLPSRYTLRWGLTKNYNYSLVSDDILLQYHSVEIEGLQSNTTYYYELLAYDDKGKEYILSRNQFSTLDVVDTTPPLNVSNLKAIGENNDVRLTWKNPVDKDFAKVRVVRSHLFYPENTAAGYIVYEGAGEEVLDFGAFRLSPNQYYTVFSYDYDGNISSGAIVFINQKGEAEVVDISDLEILDIDLKNVILVQEGRHFSLADEDLLIDGSKPLTISIPYDVLPEHLKTITVTFTDPDNDNSKFSFLLRVNKDKTAYTASLAPFYDKGNFKISISIFDYQTKLVKGLEAVIESQYALATESMTTFTYYLERLAVYIIWFFGLFFLLLVWYLFSRKSKEKKAE